MQADIIAVANSLLAAASFWPTRGKSVVALLVLAVGTTVIFALPSFWPVLMANTILAVIGDVFGPAVAALTLGLVARKRLARRMGRNSAYDHAGNVTTPRFARVASIAAPIGVCAASPVRLLTVVISPTEDWLHCCCVTRKTLRNGPSAPRTSASRKLSASSASGRKRAEILMQGSDRKGRRRDEQRWRRPGGSESAIVPTSRGVADSWLGGAPLPLAHRRFHRQEHGAAGLQLVDQALQHQHAVAAADDEGVAGIGDDAPLHDARHVVEVIVPVLEHAARRLEATEDRVAGAYELEMRVVVERPADRHLDELGLASEHRRLLELDDVAEPRAIGQVVVSH